MKSICLNCLIAKHLIIIQLTTVEWYLIWLREFFKSWWSYNNRLQTAKLLLICEAINEGLTPNVFIYLFFAYILYSLLHKWLVLQPQVLLLFIIFVWNAWGHELASCTGSQLLTALMEVVRNEVSGHGESSWTTRMTRSETLIHGDETWGLRQLPWRPECSQTPDRVQTSQTDCETKSFSLDQLSLVVGFYSHRQLFSYSKWSEC